MRTLWSLLLWIVLCWFSTGCSQAPKPEKKAAAPAQVERKKLPPRLYPVQQSKKWGYLDSGGKFAIEPRFMGGSVFQGELVAVQTRARMTDTAIGTGEERLVHTAKYAFIDKKGQMVGAVQSDDASFFRNGMGPVKIGQKWGYVNSAGVLAIQPQFDEAAHYSQGVAWVRAGQSAGYIDAKGKLLHATPRPSVG